MAAVRCGNAFRHRAADEARSRQSLPASHGVLKPGATIAQANEELGAISGASNVQFPEETGHIAYCRGFELSISRAVSGLPCPR